MNSNANRISNAPQFVALPKITTTVNGTATYDVELPADAFVEYVEVTCTSAFSTTTAGAKIKVGTVGSTPDDDAFLAVKTISGAAGAHSSAPTLRYKYPASDRLVRITVTNDLDTADGVVWVKIWFGFEPNHQAEVIDASYDPNAYQMGPGYLVM